MAVDHPRGEVPAVEINDHGSLGCLEVGANRLNHSIANQNVVLFKNTCVGSGPDPPIGEEDRLLIRLIHSSVCTKWYRKLGQFNRRLFRGFLLCLFLFFGLIRRFFDGCVHHETNGLSGPGAGDSAESFINQHQVEAKRSFEVQCLTVDDSRQPTIRETDVACAPGFLLGFLLLLLRADSFNRLLSRIIRVRRFLKCGGLFLLHDLDG